MAFADKISLIRHYPYVKNAVHEEFELLVRKKRFRWVSEIEQARIHELEHELRLHSFEELTEDVRQKISHCLDANNEILFCYEPEWTQREIDTARDLIDRFQIPEKKVFEIEMPGPRGGIWVNYLSEYRAKLNSIILKASERETQVREIVLIWRRSDSYSFLNYVPSHSTGAFTAREKLEKEAVISMDTNGNVYAWEVYPYAFFRMEKNANWRRGKKIIESWQVRVNWLQITCLWKILMLGDRVEYKDRAVEIGLSNGWYPVINKVTPSR